MPELEQMKQKYASVLNFINQQGVRLAHVHIQDNKLYIEGACGTEAIKNKIWDQVKLVDPSFSDLTLNLSVDPSLAPKQQIYTVAAGDSLSKIAKQFYGQGGAAARHPQLNSQRKSD